MAQFRLHEKLAADCIPAGRLPVSQLLLMNDERFPWFILVPQRVGISEICQLPESDQQQLWKESALLSAGLLESFTADKINIGALGNLVPQLHVHHVARFRSDACWPGPVWGCGQPVPGDESTIRSRLHVAQGWFDGQLVMT